MTKLKSGSWPTRIQVATGKSNKDRGERESEGERLSKNGKRRRKRSEGAVGSHKAQPRRAHLR